MKSRQWINKDRNTVMVINYDSRTQRWRGRVKILRYWTSWNGSSRLSICDLFTIPRFTHAWNTARIFTVDLHSICLTLFIGCSSEQSTSSVPKPSMMWTTTGTLWQSSITCIMGSVLRISSNWCLLLFSSREQYVLAFKVTLLER